MDVGSRPSRAPNISSAAPNSICGTACRSARLFSGEIMHNPVQVPCPDINSGFCQDPAQARAVRRRVLSEAASTTTCCSRRISGRCMSAECATTARPSPFSRGSAAVLARHRRRRGWKGSAARLRAHFQPGTVMRLVRSLLSAAGRKTALPAGAHRRDRIVSRRCCSTPTRTARSPGCSQGCRSKARTYGTGSGSPSRRSTVSLVFNSICSRIPFGSRK
jgi:hypothetical protein